MTRIDRAGRRMLICMAAIAIITFATWLFGLR
jgi:hypothetical protein